jgi:hypothetical protein
VGDYNEQPDLPAIIRSLSERLSALERTQLTAFGTATITWPGASPRANNTLVNHGLGRTPSAAFALPHTGVGASLTVMPVPIVRNTMTDTTFEVSAVTSDESSPAGATTATVWWVAFV